MRVLSLLLLSFSLPLLADTSITSQIHDVDYGHKSGDEILVFLKSGDVARIDHKKASMLDTLTSQKSSGNNWIKFTLDKNRKIKKMRSVPAPVVKTSDMEKGMALLDANYVPTTIANMDIAKRYIAESRHPTKELTQCFNRAMVWSYEWWRKHSLKTNKVFVFWTKDYVRKYGFKWWFHVSPYAHIMDSDGVVKERVLDVKWLSRPYAFQDWANYHSSHDVKCKVIQNYSEYANYPFGADRCYFMRANMYTWQPADLEMKEAWGYTKEGFNMDEVRAAYLEAFDITL
jgi:hypothetical protein